MSEEADWIEWKGGECPVDPETIVRVIFPDDEDRDAVGENRDWPARKWGAQDGNDKDWWQHQSEDPNYHIIAYRVVHP